MTRAIYVPLMVFVMVAAMVGARVIANMILEWRCKTVGHRWISTETGFECGRCRHALMDGDEL